MSGPSEAIVALADDLLEHGLLHTEQEYTDLVEDCINELYDGDALNYENG